MEKVTFVDPQTKESIDFFVVEETQVNGTRYFFVTEEEDGDCDAYILKEVATEAGISQNDSKKAERPERKKRTSVKENKKEKTSKLKIIPLGGLEQIGMNITAFEYEDSIIVVDCGLSFPEDDMYGIDLVIPDVTYLKDNIDKVKGFFITHGHEDHIGAIPYVLRDINVPIYATSVSLNIS